MRVIFENDDDEKERVRCWEIYTFFSDGHKVHPDRLRDWTSTPKANGYRALHLTAMGPDGKWIEVQIRSRKMDEIAELGYAAHWKYKTGEHDDDTELDKWMNTIKDILANPEPNAIDFLDTIKLNLFSSEIYVFTPKGDLITLPTGATVLDLAFEIHTELGRHCIAGKIAHKLVPLAHKLESGDQVEIITSETQTPQPEWMEYCHTAKAQNYIRTVLRKDRRLLVNHGRSLFNEFVAKENLKNSLKLVKTIRDHYGIASDDDLYYHIACDEIALSPEEMKDIYKGRSSIIKKLLRNPFSSKKDDGKNGDGDQIPDAPVPINRKEVYVLHPDLEKPNYLVQPCCNPIPGDDVLGFVNSDEQVVLHKVSCSNAMRLKSSYGPRLVATRWGEIAERFTVVIAAEGIDRHGVLEEITDILSNKLGLNIRGLSINARQEVFHCEITVQVDSTAMADRICQALKDIKGIKSAQRIS